jgi:hypothetical protein
MKGSELRSDQQREVLSSYIHRYTKDHVPRWAKSTKYPVQFESDSDWLEHTQFAVANSGELDKRVRHCMSNPTWPDNPELRR